MNKFKTTILSGWTIILIHAILSSACGTKEHKQETSAKTNAPKTEVTEEWTDLFNGRDFDGWRKSISEEAPGFGWKIENRELIVTGSKDGATQKAGDIITRQKYSDFELEWEWKMLTIGGNSGVKYYVNFYGDNKSALGIEYQILDDNNFPWMLDGRMKPGDYHTCGAAYELYEPNAQKAAPVGEWNKSKIISHNGHVEHWLNGSKIVEFNRFSEDFREKVAKSKFKDSEGFGQQESGHILLQDHPGKTHFRNIRIREFN